jgi:hypothetical protein
MPYRDANAETKPEQDVNGEPERLASSGMSLRQYKKMAKRYRDILISEGHAKPDDFWYPSKDDEESVFPGAQVNGCHHIWGVVVKRGTPLYLPERVDYWGEACDPDCPIRVYKEINWWAICGDSFIRKQLCEPTASPTERTPND